MSVDQLLAWDDKSKNQMGKFLSEKIEECASIDILTGYFFFDGINEIQKALHNNKNIKLRILVGMDAGIDTQGLVHKVYERENRVPSSDLSAEYISTLKDLLDHWEPREVSEKQIELWNQYAKMIENGDLEIRKTREANHSKLYIFHHQDGSGSYTGGSSNFSYSGLAGRNEFNVYIKNEFIREVCTLFENLWETALPIVDYATHQGTSELPKVLRQETPGRQISPFDAYMKLMWEYLKLNRSDEKLENRVRGIIRSVKFIEFKYQIDAVSRAKKILDSNGGVIIADVVGLGKSVIASLLARLSDGPGVVLAPRTLIDGAKGWQSYLDKFALTEMGWQVFSLHDTNLANEPAVQNAWTVIIDEAHNLRNEKTNLYDNLQASLANKRIICLSATPYNNRPGDLLSLIKLFPSPEIAGKSKVEFTGKIKEIAKKHNDLVDERRSLKEDTLRQNSTELYTLAEELHSLIYPLTIRRNRIDLKENYKEEVGDKIPEFRPPINLKAELTAEQGEFYEAILSEYFAGEGPAFKGAMYQPQTYIVDKDSQTQRQTNLYSMICRFMVSRWESSPVAFYKTLENISASLQASLEVLEKHGIFFRGINEYEGEESDEDLPEDALATGKHTDLIKQISKAKKTLPVYVTPEVAAQVKKDLPNRDVFTMRGEKLQQFEKELGEDLGVLKKIQGSFISCGLGSLDSQGKFQAKPENDGKLQALKKLIKEVLEDRIGEDRQESGNPRKIIVFSYYADTARYVHDYLEKCFPDKLLYMDGSTKNVESKLGVEKHFMSLKPNDDAYKDSLAKMTEKMILVCTDVLSEGINLNQAGVVVNYDISYNPVRVIQRRGRIDRIDQKVFERLYSVNFFPTAKGEDINRVGDISIRKMKMIHHILGEDACILSDEEKPRASVKSKAQKNDKENSEEELEKLTDVDEYEKRMVSDETRIANLFQQGLSDKCGANEKEKTAYQATLDAIGRGRWAILPGSSSNQLYIFKQNTAAFFVTKLPDVNNPQSQAEQVSCYKAFEAIHCKPDTQGQPFQATIDNPFWKAYQSFISGKAHGLIKPPPPDNQKKAIRCIRMLPTELKNKTGQMIRKDGMFAQKILTCENINEENIAELIKTTEENYQKLTVDNSVEVMFVGISNGESK